MPIIIKLSSNKVFLIGILISIVSLLLRIFHIDYQPLWLDEIFSFFLVAQGEWPEDFLRESNPPLYFLLLNVWGFMIGSDELSLRLMSAILGFLFVIATFWTSSVLFNKTAAIYASIFAAISPIHIYYSQEVRSYVLLTVLLMMSYGSLWKAMCDKGKYWWYIFLICVACSMYAHYFALLALLPTIIPVLVRRYRSHCLVPYSVVVITTGILVGAWVVPSILFGAGDEGAHIWINDIWLQTPPYLAIFKSLELLGIGSQQHFVPIFLNQFITIQFPELIRWIGIFSLISIAISILLSTFRKENDSFVSKVKVVWLIISLLLPLVILWIVSWFSPYYVVGRYDIIVFPAYALCVGLGFSLLHHNGKWGIAIAPLLYGCLVFAIVSKLYFYFRAPAVHYGPSAEESAKVLAANVKNGDTVVFAGTRMLPIIFEFQKYNIYWDGKKSCIDNNNAVQFICVPMPLDAADLGMVIGGIRYEFKQLQSNKEKINWLIKSQGDSGRLWLIESDFRTPNTARNMKSLMLGLSRAGYFQSNLNQEIYRLKIRYMKMQKIN